MPQGKKYTIESVEKALRILSTFSESDPELSMTDISNRLGLTINNTFRLLATLEQSEFIYKNPETQKYSLGAAVERLSPQHFNDYGLREIASPYMIKLRDHFNETAIIYLIKNIKNNQRVCLARCESNHLLRQTVRINDCMPITRGVSGRIILAYLPMHDRKYLQSIDPHYSDKILEQTRLDGWAIGHGEREPGLDSVGAPIFAPDGRIFATLSITGASVRFNPANFSELPQVICECAAKITEEISKRAYP